MFPYFLNVSFYIIKNKIERTFINVHIKYIGTFKYLTLYNYNVLKQYME